MTPFAATVVAPDYPPQVKHKIIFDTFNKLQPSESMLLINDHDPVPLRFQFDAMYKGTFEWEYLEQGPDLFRVKISKVAE